VVKQAGVVIGIDVMVVNIEAHRGMGSGFSESVMERVDERP
jgi:hypothetical protein